MAATRFYFEPTAAVSGVLPTFDGGWEQTGQALRRQLVRKNKLNTLSALANSSAITVPITTTQDYLAYQFISEPLPAQRLIGTVNFVMRCFENATTNNVSLAVVVKVVSLDGGTIRGTIFSNFNLDTEFPITTGATRIISAGAITELTIQTGDRLVVEVGGHGTGPTVAGSYTLRVGYSSATDLAYSSGVTTDDNPSFEMSIGLFDALTLSNYAAVRADSGISVTEMWR